MPSGYTATLPDDVLLDTAVMYVGSTPWGASLGGVKWDPVVERRNVAFDGRRSPVAGLDRVLRYGARVTGSFIEFSAANIKRILGNFDPTIGGGITTWKPRAASSLWARTEYVPFVYLYFQRASGGQVRITIPLAEMEWTWEGKDNEEAIYNLTINAVIDMTVVPDTDAAPFYIEKSDTGFAATPDGSDNDMLLTFGSAGILYYGTIEGLVPDGSGNIPTIPDIRGGAYPVMNAYRSGTQYPSVHGAGTPGAYVACDQPQSTGYKTPMTGSLINTRCILYFGSVGPKSEGSTGGFGMRFSADANARYMVAGPFSILSYGLTLIMQPDSGHQFQTFTRVPNDSVMRPIVMDLPLPQAASGELAATPLASLFVTGALGRQTIHPQFMNDWTPMPTTGNAFLYFGGEFDQSGAQTTNSIGEKCAAIMALNFNPTPFQLEAAQRYAIRRGLNTTVLVPNFGKVVGDSRAWGNGAVQQIGPIAKQANSMMGSNWLIDNRGVNGDNFGTADGVNGILGHPSTTLFRQLRVEHDKDTRRSATHHTLLMDDTNGFGAGMSDADAETYVTDIFNKVVADGGILYVSQSIQPTIRPAFNAWLDTMEAANPGSFVVVRYLDDERLQDPTNFEFGTNGLHWNEDGMMAQAQKWVEKLPAPTVTPPGKIVFDGADLILGTGVTTAQRFTEQLKNTPPWMVNISMSNLATTGAKVSDVSARAAATDALLTGSGQQCLFLMVGMYDLQRSTQTPAQIADALFTYAVARYNAGWKRCIVSTVIPAKWLNLAPAVADQATLNSRIATFNNYLRMNHRGLSQYIYLHDPAIRAPFNVNTAWSNATYYQADGVNLTPAGHNELFRIAKPYEQQMVLHFDFV